MIAKLSSDLNILFLHSKIFYNEQFRNMLNKHGHILKPVVWFALEGRSVLSLM